MKDSQKIYSKWINSDTREYVWLYWFPDTLWYIHKALGVESRQLVARNERVREGERDLLQKKNLRKLCEW